LFALIHARFSTQNLTEIERSLFCSAKFLANSRVIPSQEKESIMMNFEHQAKKIIVGSVTYALS